MAVSRRDVRLVISARDDATKAFDAVSAALDALVNANQDTAQSAQNAGARLSELSGIAERLDKAYAQMNTSAEGATNAFSRQQREIRDSEDRLSALRAQAEHAATAITKLKTRIQEQSKAGFDTSAMQKELKGAVSEADRLGRSITKLSVSIDDQNNAVRTQQSVLQQLGSTIIGVESAQSRLRAAIEATTPVVEAQRSAEGVYESLRGKIVLLNKAIASRTAEEKAAADAMFASLKRQIAEVDRTVAERTRAEQKAAADKIRAQTEAEKEAARLIKEEEDKLFASLKRQIAEVNRVNDERSIAERKAAAERIAAEREYEDGLARVLNRVSPLIAIQRDYNEAIATANRYFKDGKIGIRQYTDEMQAAADGAERLARKVLDIPSVDPNKLIGQDLSGGSARESASFFNDEERRIQRERGLAERAVADEVKAAVREQHDEYERLKRAQDELAASAAKLRAQIDPLGEIQRRLAASTAEARRLLAAEQITADECALAIKHLENVATHAAQAIGKVSFSSNSKALFGLRPYELQNLSYQINDVFTQLGSGTPFLQVVAQQGGQIIQIFEGVGEKLLAAFTNPAFIAAAAAVLVTIASIARAMRDAGNIRTFDAALTSIAGGASYTAQSLADITVVIDRMGISFEDAQKTVREFLTQGFDTATIEALSKTATNMAFVLGIEVPAAAKKLGNALRKGYEGIEDLDREINFLTDAELEHTRSLAEQGKTAEAATFAMDILGARYGDAADKQRGPWAEAVLALGNAWDSFLSMMSKTWLVIGMVDALRLLGDGLEYVFDQIDRRLSKPQGIEVIKSRIDALTSDIEASKKLLDEVESGRRELAPNASPELRQKTIDTLKKRIADLEGRRNLLDNIVQGSTATADTPDGLSGNDELRRKANRELQRLTDRNKHTTDTATDDERRAAAVREATEKALQDIARGNLALADEAVQKAYIKSAVDKATLEINEKLTKEKKEQNREAEAAAKKIETYNDALKRQLETRQQDVDQLRAREGLQGAALIAKQREQAIEDALRKNRQEAEKAGAPTDTAEFKGREAEIRRVTGAYFDLQHARELAELPIKDSERNVAALKSQQGELQKSIEFEQSRGNFAGAEQLQRQLDSVNARLSEALQHTIKLWEALANNPAALAALGKTREEIEAIILSLRNSTPAANNWGRQFLATSRQINESFASGATDAFDRFAQKLVETGKVFTSLRDAFLQFASDFLREIARMIIKQALFNAFGGPQGNGGVGASISGAIGSMFGGGGGNRAAASTGNRTAVGTVDRVSGGTTLIDAIKGFEGFKEKAYWDNKQWSIGYGTKSQEGATITQAAAELKLREEVAQAQASVNAFAPNAPQGVKDALSSLTYNAGPGWQNEGLGEAVKAGDYAKAKALFLQYNKENGAVSPGLTTRRENEAKWFDNPLEGSTGGLGKTAGFNNAVDARLTDVLNTAATRTGYKVDAISGYRPGDPRYHGQGLATDVQLYGPDGKALGNYQDPANFRQYEQFAQEARRVQMEKYPELNDQFRWGGYFSGQKGEYGALDTMHFDIDKKRVGMGGGSWENGLNPQMRSYWGADSVGMGQATTSVTSFTQSLDAAKTSTNAFGQGIEKATEIATTKPATTATPGVQVGTPGTPGTPGTDIFSGIANSLSSLMNSIFSMFSGLLKGIIGIFSGGGGGGGGLGGIIGSLVTTFFHHTGGVVGSGAGWTQSVSSSVFDGAMRYHDGGIAGLKPDEVPAVLQKGEEVLTSDDPRHVNNGGGAGGQAPMNIRNIVAFDPSDVLSMGLGTKVGERTLINFLRENKTSVNSALG